MGRSCIIIGTQIIAKGHHFPKLTCVGIIDADLGLTGGDLRASERTFQLLHQVAGRAGRESEKGHVYLQTFSPATRVFEAAGAAACLITDAWEGIEHFLTPDEEVLVARDGQDVAEHLAALTPERAHAIGQAALTRVTAEHTYALRAVEVDALFRAHVARQAAA